MSHYLCASFRIPGVPSKSVERLSGATIKTLAMLDTKTQSVNLGKAEKIIENRKLGTEFWSLHAQQLKLFINRRSIETTYKFSVLYYVTLQPQSST